MDTPRHLLVCALGDQRLALPLMAVERVVWAVEVTPLPGAPQSVLGVINVEGRVVPVIDLRRRYGIPDREIDLADRFVIARTSRRTVALLVDWADVVASPAGAFVRAEEVLPAAGPVREVIKGDDGLVLVYDPDVLLSLDEARALDTLGNGAAEPVPGPGANGGADGEGGSGEA